VTDTITSSDEMGIIVKPLHGQKTPLDVERTNMISEGNQDCLAEPVVDLSRQMLLW
jgi:hypothetical protein